MSDPHVEEPSPEVERPTGSAALPGARKTYSKLPTGPVSVEPVMTGPDADTGGLRAEWEPAAGETYAEDRTRLAPWALFAAIVALCTALFVGWGIPVAIIAVIAAIMSIRRPVESRAVAIWALVLGITATVFSSGWLIWAVTQFERLG
ncbi:hypothetical protein L2X99_10150 [Microbacterium sp. KUDC0406]|uniref:hypothetical protein n=1 Tax=Microbacterium sp. KUDC0406 TaxID=2909588 RepID=UPI001F4778E5|nr:hypothetical protein [Microbacterium sp. KUDC0406]UJP08858.1 hypothetical protein L2X99_10150 [Microbacterium sp. KUDC0406]